MKTTMIARCVFAGAAIFAAAGLIGCGAESGQGESGAIGSTSEALAIDNSATAPIPAITAGKEREFAASCKIFDGTTEKLLVAGGFDSSGNPRNDLMVYTPGTPGAWAYPGATLNTARGHARMIQMPGDTHACLIVAGSATLDGAAITTNVAEVITVSGGAFAVGTAYNGHTLTFPAARAKFQLSTCANNAKVVVFGGEDNGTELTSNTIQTFDPANPATPWANTTNQLTVKRWDFGILKDGENFIVAAGKNVGTGPLANVELFKNLCVTSPAHTNAGSVLATAREGVAVIPAHTTNSPDDFFVLGGLDGSSPTKVLLTDTEKFTPTWGATPSLSAGTVAAGAITGTHLPLVVDAPSVSKTLFLGGDDYLPGSSVRDTISAVQERKTSGATGAWESVGTLRYGGRVGAVGEIISGNVYVATGISTASDVKTFYTSGETITP